MVGFDLETTLVLSVGLIGVILVSYWAIKELRNPKDYTDIEL